MQEPSSHPFAESAQPVLLAHSDVASATQPRLCPYWCGLWCPGVFTVRV